MSIGFIAHFDCNTIKLNSADENDSPVDVLIYATLTADGHQWLQNYVKSCITMIFHCPKVLLVYISSLFHCLTCFTLLGKLYDSSDSST